MVDDLTPQNTEPPKADAKPLAFVVGLTAILAALSTQIKPAVPVAPSAITQPAVEVHPSPSVPVTPKYTEPVIENPKPTKELDIESVAVKFDKQTACDQACLSLKSGYVAGFYVHNGACHCFRED